jgi:hypothetical protein
LLWPTPKPQVPFNATAPFIYFDTAATYGTNNGAIEIELTARTIIPVVETNSVRNEALITAHIRCSPNAAMSLKFAIEKALEMLANPAQPQAQPGPKLN